MPNTEPQDNDSDWILNSEEIDPSFVSSDRLEYSVEVEDSKYMVTEERRAGYSIVSVRQNGTLLSAGTFFESTGSNKEDVIAELGESYVSECLEDIGYEGPVSFLEENTDLWVEENNTAQSSDQFIVDELEPHEQHDSESDLSDDKDAFGLNEFSGGK